MWINKIYFNIFYLVFFKGPLGFLKNIFIKSPFFVPKIDLNEKCLSSKNSKIYFTHISRLYFYTLGINYRLKNLLNEYSISRSILSLKKSDIVIDCGANIGEFSLAIYNEFKCKNIYAFEPDENEYKALNKNLNFGNCKPLKLGLSNKTGDFDFYLNNETGDSSLIYSRTNEKTKIKTITLDDFVKKFNIKSIALLKIEAEGFEPEIILGAIPVLNKIKYITIDCSPERNGNTTFSEINDILVKNNFTLLNFNSLRMSLLFQNKLIN